MSSVMNSLGFDAGSNLSVFLLCTIFTFAVVTILWVVGLVMGNHSSMDGWYGFAYAAPAAVAYVVTGAQSVTAAILLFMVMLHGGRLGWYLARRWRLYVGQHGGDPRYVRFVEQYSPGYWWKSFFRVMEPQAVIIVLIGSPVVVGILTNRVPNGGLNLLAVLGLLVFMVGLYHETVADAQLQSFLALSERPRYLNTGVWTYSRHPNYFGTTTVWWGMWLVAVAGNPDCWWTVVGPVLNTIMLTSVLGSAFQDNYMGSRPEYQELIARTRRFLPIPLSETALARKQEQLAEQRAKATSS
jgi:steroid 5-alpha reductase family enzyme